MLLRNAMFALFSMVAVTTALEVIWPTGYVPTEAEEEEINEFEIEFEGPDGDQKTIKIRYR